MGAEGRISERFVARSNDVAARRLGDEVFVMSGRDSTLFSLNPTAAALWEHADGSATLAELVRRHVCPTFEVEFEAALRDAEELVEALAGHGLLELSDEPAQAAPGPAP